MYSVILCGGSGTRLWPLSRKNYPKQFLNLYSDKSLLQETFLRMANILPERNILLVSNEKNFFNVYNQIKEIYSDFSKDQILVEPESLNTAPAIAYAMKYLRDELGVKKDSPVIILPADHHIGKKNVYATLVKKAFREIGDNIGTIGITPTKPETGYGYIKKGKRSNGFFRVDEFREKPDKKTAQKYLKSGKYVWNSGMYLFNYQTFLAEIKKYAPEIATLMEKDMDKFLHNFKKMPSISIDYALSEKSDKVVVFEGEFGWSDIGSFDSLADVLSGKKDKDSRHIKIDSTNTFIHSETDKLIATIGVENLIIVENNDSILIQKRGESERVKEIVAFLKDKKLKEIDNSVIVYRPWGKYEVLIDGSHHSVRKLTIYPKESLNLQIHNQRVEHWIIIKGQAKVKKGAKEIKLGVNESIFIPKKTKHQLSNPGKVNLEIIEVQTGNYLGDDDIINL
ncbi:MAG: mannose-1-phosphate guanylyltransferase/mannose-6-phosphate isomerase [Parcubacteria group bacterium]